MSRPPAATAWDLAGVAAAAAFLLATPFEDMRNRVTEAIAILVAGLSLWRVYRRHRPGGPGA